MARFPPSSALATVPSKRGGGGGMPIASGARGVPDCLAGCDEAKAPFSNAFS